MTNVEKMLLPALTNDFSVSFKRQLLMIEITVKDDSSGKTYAQQIPPNHLDIITITEVIQFCTERIINQDESIIRK